MGHNNLVLVAFDPGCFLSVGLLLIGDSGTEFVVCFAVNCSNSRVWFDRVSARFVTAPAKPSAQVRQMVAAMASMEERVMEVLKELLVKVNTIEDIGKRLHLIDNKLAQQGERLDRVQTKVDLSMTSLGQVQQEQTMLARALKATAAAAPESSLPTPPQRSPPLLPTPTATSGASTSATPPPHGDSPREQVSRVPVTTSAPEVGEFAPRRQWSPKMDFPKFSGSDVRVWLDNCETFFLFYQIADGYKVSAAVLNMSGDAANWYQEWKFEQGWHDWPMLKAALLGEFEVNLKDVKMDELLLLTQTGSVSDYQSKFNQLVYQIRLYDPLLSPNFLIRQFLLGLKDELRVPVQAQQPTSVTQAFLVALAYESALPSSGSKKSVSKKNFQVGRGGEKQKLAPGELWKAQQLKEYRRAQGLCFKCGDKYTPGHVCSKQETPQLKAMELQEEAIVLTDELLDAVTGLELSEDSANLSLHALAGTSHTNTVQLRALSSNQVLIVLVDSGSSHSFINSALCHRLHLLSEPIPPTSVRVANGEVLVCDAKISQFDWWVQGHQFSFPVRVLPMGGYDLVLGMDWLTQYSPTTCDWAAKWLQFSYQGSLIKLQGIQSSSDLTTPQEATPEQVVKWTKGNDVWAIAVLEQSGGVTIPVSEFPEIQSLLSEFESVFQNVSDLPPHRALDHAIPLLPNAIPVNSRPYSYSPAQKDEIERQVSEMLSARLITTSCSPFASPVLLVKKKDNSWRFCVDYRRLNALTVKNKFPLPIGDELLDELAGTKYFSKLDLRSGYHQIRMLEFDEYKTAFKTHHGHFQFRVMPFGLTNAPATFQCLMNSIFAPFLRKFVLLFMDDILIYSKSWEDHLQHLKCVLQLL